MGSLTFLLWHVTLQWKKRSVFTRWKFHFLCVYKEKGSSPPNKEAKLGRHKAFLHSHVIRKLVRNTKSQAPSTWGLFSQNSHGNNSPEFPSRVKCVLHAMNPILATWLVCGFHQSMWVLMFNQKDYVHVFVSYTMALGYICSQIFREF